MVVVIMVVPGKCRDSHHGGGGHGDARTVTHHGNSHDDSGHGGGDYGDARVMPWQWPWLW